MCFYPGKSAKVKVAEKDIVCYKILLGDDLGAVYGYPYLKNKRTPVIELKIRQNSLEKSYITRGYHSFKQLKSAIVSGFAWEHIGKFVIPKGALYYSNKSEYVSETIIFVKRLEKYSKCF